MRASAFPTKRYGYGTQVMSPRIAASISPRLLSGQSRRLRVRVTRVAVEVVVLEAPAAVVDPAPAPARVPVLVVAPALVPDPLPPPERPPPALCAQAGSATASISTTVTTRPIAG
jgi:hypothetical protein